MRQRTIAPLFGAVFALLAVAAGAFGEHLLEKVLTADQLDAWRTAARYQMFHGVALLIPLVHGSRWTSVCFIVGTILFSGSLYTLSLLDWSWLWPVTPLGGLTLMLGWSGLIVALIRSTNAEVPDGR